MHTFLGNTHLRLLFLALLVQAPLSGVELHGQEASNGEAKALLRGAAAERSKVQMFRVELTMTYNPLLGDDGIYKIVIEQSGDNRRLECLPGSREASVNILAPDHVRRFIREPHEDLCVYTIKNAVGGRGVLVFDPRGLGLSNGFVATDTVDGLFWLDIGESFTMNGEESLNGTLASRVVVSSVVGTSEYWISQPDFRVHRRTIRWKGGDSVTIDSEYNGAGASVVFPTAVHVVNSGKNTDIIDIEVTRFDSNAKIDNARFDDSTIGMPGNTVRSDYRTNTSTGYWDGQQFRDDPIGKRELDSSQVASAVPAETPLWRYLLAGGIVLACGALMLIIWMRRVA